MVPPRGIRLNTLSKEKGSTSRTATSAHRIHITFLGAFFRKKRTSTTARISQPAWILRFSNFIKTAVMEYLLSEDQR